MFSEVGSKISKVKHLMKSLVLNPLGCCLLHRRMNTTKKIETHEFMFVELNKSAPN